MKKFLILFMRQKMKLVSRLINTFFLFIGASVLYCIMNLIYGKVLVSFMYTSAYHWQYPYAFLIVFAISYFIILSILVIKTKKELIQFYCYWIFLFIILSGVLWSFFDMENGYYPRFPMSLHKIGYDILRSIIYSPLIMLGSIPYNIMIFLYSYYLIKRYNNVY